MMLLVFSGLVSAADEGDPIDSLERIYDEAPYRLGPLKIRPQLYVSRAGVDSNVYGSSTGPVSDFTLTTGPAGTFYLRLTKHLLLSLYESPRYVYYRDEATQRGWNNVLTGRQYLALNRFLLTFTETVVNVRERYDTEVDIRPRRFENAAQASVLWQTARRTPAAARWGDRYQVL